MSWSASRKDIELETTDNSVIIHDSLGEFNFEETDFKELWRTDLYGNYYILSKDENFLFVRPELESINEYTPESMEENFSQLMKYNLAYATNLVELEAESVTTPNFQTGVYADDENIFPFTVMEKPEGTPLSELEHLLDEEDGDEEVRDQFERYNNVGRSLAASNRIIYPAQRSNEDLMVEIKQDEPELHYTNPGSYLREAFFNQFQKSDVVPSNRRRLGDWLGTSYWQEKLSV